MGIVKGKLHTFANISVTVRLLVSCDGIHFYLHFFTPVYSEEGSFTSADGMISIGG